MSERIDDNRKQELCRIMALNLPTLRTKADLSQEKLAERIGLSRQTISSVESGKRELQWNVFITLALFFQNDDEIRTLMSAIGIIDEKLEKLLGAEAKRL